MAIAKSTEQLALGFPYLRRLVTLTQFEATEDGKNIRVRFTLPDPPTVKGSIDGPLPSNYLTPTQSLITQLKTAIDAGTFTVDGADTNTGNVSSTCLSLLPLVSRYETVRHIDT